MKTIKIICLMATVMAAVACSKSSNENGSPSEQDVQGQQSGPSTVQLNKVQLRLNNQESTDVSAIGYVAAGQISAIISADTKLSCAALASGSIGLPTENFLSLTFPEKIVNYGSLDRSGQALNRVALGFNFNSANVHAASVLELNVKDIQVETVTIDVNSKSDDGTDHVRGSLKISICRR